MQTYNEAWIGWLEDKQCYEIHDEHDFLKTSYIKVKDLDPKKFIMQFGEYAGSSIYDIAFHDTEYLSRIYKDSNTHDTLLKQCIYNATL